MDNNEALLIMERLAVRVAVKPRAEDMIKKIAIIISIIIAIAIIAALTFYAKLNPSPPDQQAFINGTILTMDAQNSIAEAVLVEEDKVVQVGSTQSILELTNKDTLIVDLDGKTLTPGFIDAHGHFPGSGLNAVAVDLNSPPIGPVTTIAQALQLLKQKAAETPKGKWVVGYGYDDTQLKERRHFLKSELDAVSTEHPIYLVHISSHMGVGNSLALREVGIDKNTPNPTGGVIAKDKSGELTGLLLETAHLPVQERAYKFPPQEQFKISQSATQEYLSKGVTTAQNGLALEAHIKGLWPASNLGLIPIRLILWPDSKVADKVLNKELDLSDKNSKRFTIGARKLIADGSIQGYTGFLKKPYYSCPVHLGPMYKGYPSYKREELVEKVLQYHRAGHQLAIHGNGDAAIEMIIDAYENAQAQHYREDARPIIVHSQMSSPAQLQKMKELGMTPSFFTAHTYYWGDRHKNIFLGPERAKSISPMKTALDMDLPFTIHLDTPVVPMDPMLMIWNASHRLSSGGEVIGKEQRISPLQALRAITIDAAWQVFQEDNRGSIEAGKFADLVVLSENPVSSSDIRNIKVEQTYIGGVRFY